MKKERHAWRREKKQVCNQEAEEVQPLKMSNNGKYKSDLIIEGRQGQHLFTAFLSSKIRAQLPQINRGTLGLCHKARYRHQGCVASA